MSTRQAAAEANSTAGPTEEATNTMLNKHNAPVFDAEGGIGKAFTENGAIGGTAQKIGGPLDKEGIVGKQFTTQGAIGGTVQSALGDGKSK